MEQNHKIAIIGLGYVGLPLAVSFSKYYKTIGYDISENRIEELKKSIDRNIDADINELDTLHFTYNLSELKDANIYIITVPTPVKSDNTPDLSFLESATKIVSNLIKKNDIIIYESTVYPGVTEDFCVPLLERFSNFKFNIDFFCGYSPERINPGDKLRKLEDIVKVTSGSNSEVATIIDDLYKKIIRAGTFKASSIKVAEASKVIENVQRDVNIALMNELAMMFDKMNISTKDVLDAAKTKWNFLDFKPGLVGGHCISIDPYYLIYKSKDAGYAPDLINTSREINNHVSSFICYKTKKLLLKQNIKLKNADVLILGYTFKENCLDTRNTQVKMIFNNLQEDNCCVDIYDPLLNNNNSDNPFLKDKKYDAIILAVAHKQFYNYTINDFNLISKEKLVLLDIKGIYDFSTWTL